MYRNTLGDLNPPDFDYWQKIIDKKDQTQYMKAVAVFMHYYIWILWLIQTIGLLIMMLNLLVSILGTVYEESQEDVLVNKYTFRASMINEAMAIKSFFRMIFKPFASASRASVLVLQFCTLKDDDEDEDSAGATEQINNMIQAETKKLRANMNQSINELKA